ncbi:MAG: acyl-CoA dehydrogenase family protein [Bacillus sp. (in: firmicutes)]
MLTEEVKFDYMNIAISLANEFSRTAVERDKRGGTAKTERDLLRKSGLLSLIIPKAYGGLGGNWLSVLNVTRELAKKDGSLAHLFGYHSLCLASVQLFGTVEQTERAYKETAEKQLFWGNTFNPRDQSLRVQKRDNEFILSGKKNFCSGSSDSDVLLISANCHERVQPIFGVIPSNREGITIQDDWDSFGQRQTDSGSVLFKNVVLKEDEVLDYFEGNSSSLFPTIRTHIAQTILLHVLLGITEGALEEAKQYTKEFSRPWLTSNVDLATADPYILQQYGEMQVALRGAEVLAKEAAVSLQNIWEQEHSLTTLERGNCSITIATAKVAVTKAALHVSQTMFEVMGARATSGKYGYDRYWRNIRTHTLHDPLSYKLRDIGNWSLNNQLPEITPYS